MQIKQRLRRRTGTTAIEMALIIPILFGLLFAAVDFARVQNVRNTAALAAYEGARQGILPGGKRSDVMRAVRRSLRAVGVEGAAITIQPNAINDDTPRITVHIATPLDQNLWAYSTFFAGKTVTAECSLFRELELAK